MTDQDKQCVTDTARILAATDTHCIFTAELVPALRTLPDGDDYRAMTDDALVGALTAALGPVRWIRGTTLSGTPASGYGHDASPILAAAAELAVNP